MEIGKKVKIEKIRASADSEILQDIIDLCRSKGFKFVNLDELIKHNAYV